MAHRAITAFRLQTSDRLGLVTLLALLFLNTAQGFLHTISHRPFDDVVHHDEHDNRGATTNAEFFPYVSLQFQLNDIFPWLRYGALRTFYSLATNDGREGRDGFSHRYRQI